MKCSVITLDNAPAGEIELDETVFGLPVRKDILARMVNWQLAKRRAGTHKTKGVSDISGTTKKPYKQKGTGRPQVGSTRTPLWRHGGTVFGPQPRSYDFKLSKKVEIGALRSALAEKIKSGDVIVVDALGATAIKTKAAVEMLKRLGITGKAVLVDVAADDKLSRSVRNIPGVSLVASARLTARDVIAAGRVVATRGALEKLQEALG